MGLFSKALRRRRHRAGPEVDLLSAAFGFPFRHGIKFSSNKSPGRMKIVYDPPSDSNDESDSEETCSSSSEDDRGRQQHRDRCLSERPPTPHRSTPASPSSSRKSSSRKKQHHRRRSRASSRSSPRKSTRSRISRSTSRRSNVGIMISQPSIPPYVQSSATFPPRIPIHLSKPPCNIVQSKTFPISTLNQPFGLPVCQPMPQQQVYYQNPVNYGPPQPSPTIRAPAPQFIAPAMPPPFMAQPPSGLATAPVSSATLNSNVIPPVVSGVDSPKPNSEAPGPSDPWTKEIKLLQKHIDAKMADLSSEPNSRVLRRDLRRLQDRLNLTLNKAITHSKKSHTRKLSLTSISDFSQLALDGDTASEAATAPIRDRIVPMDTTYNDQQRRYRAQQFKSPRRIPLHHVCSGCGNVRSQQFHKRWPLSRSRKSYKISYCESCREEMYNRGIVQKYHFCFNCGGARSMAFHKQHPVLPGEPIFVNYCSSCTEESKAYESLPDVSVVNLVNPRVESHTEVVTPSDSEDDLDSLTVNRHRNRKSDRASVQSDQQPEVKPEQPAPEPEPIRGRRPEPHTPKGPIVASDVDFVPPEPPYCPSRSTSSSDRRAERKSSRQFSTDSGPHGEGFEAKGNYQAPYVEDSSSSHHSRIATPTSSLRSKKRERKTESRDCEPRKSLLPDVGLKSALAGSDRSSSDGSRKARAEISEESPRVREKSLDSDRSDPSSSKSSSSKTVRFKQSVDIRTSLPQDVDDFSEPESPRYSRSPGSPLISRKRSTSLRTKETRDKYLHPHYGQHSNGPPCFHREHLHTPDSFIPGTPSKGYSKGAFSNDFDSGGHWDSFPSPGYPYADHYSENSFRGYYGVAEDFKASTSQPYNYDQYRESTASLPSRLSTGRSATEKGSGPAGNNPYYTPRKRSYPEPSYCGSSDRSERSPKRDFDSSSSTKSDKLLWKNAFNPVPVIEELGTAGNTSPETPTDMLEFSIVIDPASPIDGEVEVVSSESYSRTPPPAYEN
ncbi:hypothetical protein FLAG1_04550 [Fusarium langsethiae]|uniref:Uncharacterized protein n=1 Tax=Fusarium langsethiae TaxID=179993 RepID=A0A0N0DFF0_FUSLA|nr:hypothetical protein FLAG1_04550 [Fusarium langsethiae]GKU00164.1 unnamed protein product [Fusarium langsethiae]GKU10587.1 unnamed protein product [Fusarium langsethiae]